MEALFYPAINRTMIEIAAAVVVGIGFVYMVRHQKKLKKSLALADERLELAHQKLHSKARNSIEQENRLTAITSFSALLNQSLDLHEIIQTAIKMVIEVIEVEVVILFSLDNDAEELRVIAFEGVNERYAAVVDRIKLGTGFCGHVAKTGKPLLVENVACDPNYGRPEAVEENLQTQLSVPLRSRSKIIGTLCVATRSPRQFSNSEVELLTAIGNLIGISMENSELYRERDVVYSQLSMSEKKYRQLFENAHDAIWVQDLSGKITTANRAAAMLFGYTLSELIGADLSQLLPQESLASAMGMNDQLLSGQHMQQPFKHTFVRRDGSEAILKITTNLVSSNGHPDGFESIGRDITNEVRMEENQQFYLQQITKAHEEERLRISRDLHDSAAQNLIGVIHHLESFCQNDEHLPIQKLRSLLELHERLKDILQEIRQLSRDLRPSIIDHLGLLAAVDWLVVQFRTDHKIETSLSVSGKEKRFSPETEVTLFRIVQESLRNIARHAEATRVTVNICFKDTETSVIVSDNGNGFELPTSLGELSRLGRLGLDGMQTRAKLVGGTFAIESESTKGTVVTVSIPA